MASVVTSTISRRRILRSLSATLAAALFPPQTLLAAPVAPNNLIDVHCHLFNATDLPARRFIKIVFLQHYPVQGSERLLDLDRKDTVDYLIDLMLFLVGAGRAPTAQHEMDVLDGVANPVQAWADLTTAGELAAQRTAEYLRQPPARRSNARSLSRPNPVRAAILRAAGMSGRELDTLAHEETTSAARLAYSSNTDIGAYLRWFTLFTLYRYSLLDRLTEIHRSQGFSPILLAPAMIDFSRWLGEDVASPLEDQVKVMARISRKHRNPAIHGYVAFDPLREVYYRRHLLKRGSLDLVREALTKYGFVGVKLYPPMGFRPSGNARGPNYPYPQLVLDDLGGKIAQDLNRALDDLYRLCLELDAPILAHSADSNGAAETYADRADPAYWLRVFAAFPKLRVCLAHFGRFSYISKAAPAHSNLPESSWEWTIGRHFVAQPNSQVFVDVSYLSEIFDDEKTRQHIGQTFRRFVSTFDPDVHRIMFGTDWVVLPAYFIADPLTSPYSHLPKDGG